MKNFKKNIASHISTIIGAGLAIANAWVNVDWETFQPDFRHIAPLVVSAIIGLGGYMTSINALKNKTDV